MAVENSSDVTLLDGYRESSYSFVSLTESDILEVKVSTIMSPEYGLFVWPSAPFLAKYVWNHQSEFQGNFVLELGSGVGLVGVVAASCGAHCILTDREDSDLVLRCLQRTVDLNKESTERQISPNISIVPFTWAQFSPAILSTPPVDIILAADCIYDNPTAVEELMCSIDFFLCRRPKAIALMAYQVRSEQRTISHLLKQWGLRGEIVASSAADVSDAGVPAGHHNALPTIENSTSLSEILIVRISKA